ncbi:ComEA family DNA-binding protein, partial [Hydrogenimonas sp.]
MKYLVFVLSMVTIGWAGIDINRADVKELMQLKGIGKKKAEVIVAYRTSHCFESVYDLARVKGIGKKTVERN